MKGAEGYEARAAQTSPNLRPRSTRSRASSGGHARRGSILARRLSALVREHHDLALPGSGKTIERFRVLAQIAEEDLSLAKLFESHADALAILDELGARSIDAPRTYDEREERWAVFCAELPTHRLRFTRASGDAVQIYGSKAFASGFAHLTHALISGFSEEGERLLAAIDLSDPGITPISGGFYAAGMSATETVDLHFEGVRGQLIGAPSAYLERPGFMYGAAGVAACWYGGTRSILRAAHRITAGRKNPHADVHLGALDLKLSAAARALRAAAEAIDADRGAETKGSTNTEIMRARLTTEAAAEAALVRVPRMVGAGALCRDLMLAPTLNDLGVYIRQSHAERDLEAHGAALRASEGGSL